MVAGVGQIRQATATLHTILSTAIPWFTDSHSIEQLTAATRLQIAYFTPLSAPLTAPLKLWVDAKNAGPALTVSLYRIDLDGWLRGQGAQGDGLGVPQIGGDIDLTAAVPSEVLTVATSGSELAYERLEVALPGTAGRRGTLVVDVASGGNVCRCDIVWLCRSRCMWRAGLLTLAM